jgi:hypothetical protein
MSKFDKQVSEIETKMSGSSDKGFTPRTKDQPQPESSTAITPQDANSAIARTLGTTITRQQRLAGHLEDQAELATDVTSDRVAAALDPHNLDALFAQKILSKLEGVGYQSPFDLVEVSLEPPKFPVRLSGCESHPQLVSSSGC